MKEVKEKKEKEPVGVDLGVKHQLALSNGEKISWYMPETRRLKKLQKAKSEQKLLESETTNQEGVGI